MRELLPCTIHSCCPSVVSSTFLGMMGAGCCSLRVPTLEGKFVQSRDGPVSKRVPAPPSQRDSTTPPSQLLISLSPASWRGEGSRGASGSGPTSLKVNNYVRSPFLSYNGLLSLHEWLVFCRVTPGKVVVYNIQHNRWCENIGRAHKSNNIM